MAIVTRPPKRLHPSAKKSAVTNKPDPNKEMAEKIRCAIVEKDIIKRSTLGLYSLKTKESAFGVPFCAISDELALTAAKQLLPLANLYRLGSFCLYDGHCSSLNKPVLILDTKLKEGVK